MNLTSIAYLVRDYDEAIAWFVNVLGFSLLEDSDLGGGKRWVRVGAPGGGSALLLAKAAAPEQVAQIGQAAGGRVGFFLHVDDFDAAHAALVGRGVGFRESPRRESYGTVAVFDDLYSNGWDLIGPPEKR